MIASRSRARRDRRGFGMIELAVAGILVAAGMTATVQVVGWVVVERRAVERRQRALVEASNLLERIAARPYDEITPEAAGRCRLAGPTADFLPGATLYLKVDTSTDAPGRKKIAVEIRWRDRSGRPEAPIRLVAWTYRHGRHSR